MFYRKHSYFPYFHSVKYRKRYVPKVREVCARACLLFAMTTSRHFVDTSDDDLVKFSEENENENTAKKRDTMLESSENIWIPLNQKHCSILQSYICQGVT